MGFPSLHLRLMTYHICAIQFQSRNVTDSSLGEQNFDALGGKARELSRSLESLISNSCKLPRQDNE